eukprot:GILK01011628.1.p1 GENE.GILK01011628.1~~GILK01011628.1.p1  ORF type:complete len:599 (-),score=53.26 GILK01011628.1:113-1879(-)
MAETIVKPVFPAWTSMGANLLPDGGCSFKIWAPHSSMVWVRFNGSKVEMQQMESEKEMWTTTIMEAKEGDTYNFVILSNWNDQYALEGAELERRDPYARHTDFNSNTCYITNPHFEWTPFSPSHKHYEDLILYEIHPGSFVGRNDPSNSEWSVFRRTVEKLDYIQSMGFNAIQLMPVNEFGGDWGYNPRLLLSIHGKYGTPLELRTLVDEAHKRGLSVLFDVVLNHGSAKLNSLWNYDGYGPNKNGGIYFEGGGSTPWGLKFAFHKQQVKDMLQASAEMFFREYNADGLRFDSVHNMPWDLLQYQTFTLRNNFPGKFLVAEITPENPMVVHGAGFDSCWLHATYYDSLKVLRGDGFKVEKIKLMLSSHRGFKRSFEAISSILGSHDQVGDKQHGNAEGGCHRYLVSLFGGRKNWHAKAFCRFLYGIMSCGRPLPMLFMGTETLQDGWWNTDFHHTFDWNLASDETGRQMIDLITDANHMRAAHSALKSDHVEFVHEDRGNAVIGCLRVAENSVLLVVINASEAQWEGHVKYGINCNHGPGTRFKQLFNSQAGKYGGWDASWTGDVDAQADGKLFINLPKWSVTVFQRL